MVSVDLITFVFFSCFFLFVSFLFFLLFLYCVFLTLADSFTSNKLQGVTTSKVIIDLCSQMHKLDFAQLSSWISYRVLDLSSSSRIAVYLSILVVLDILKPKVPNDLKQEIKRLLPLEKQTLNNFIYNLNN